MTECSSTLCKINGYSLEANKKYRDVSTILRIRLIHFNFVLRGPLFIFFLESPGNFIRSTLEA